MATPFPACCHILGFVEAGLCRRSLQKLCGFTSWNAKHRAVRHITQNSPVPSSLGLRGGRGRECTHFLPLHSRRWRGCWALLLSRWCLLLEKKKTNTYILFASHLKQDKPVLPK